MKHPAEIAQKVLWHVKRLSARLSKEENDRLTRLLGQNLILASNLRNPEDAKKKACEQIDWYRKNGTEELKAIHIPYYLSECDILDCAIRHGLKFVDYKLLSKEPG